ncbi:MAG: hypothetical protein IPL79_00050 [Myxococcales bacterium]|nr:hypothetical protein [Myxococcales bacterium]
MSAMINFQHAELSTLAIVAQGRPTASKRLARGDLAYLLDALISRLGDGLAPSGSTRPIEEEIGADHEHGGELGNAHGVAIDLGAVAKGCRSKTKKLVKRMLARLEKANAPGEAHRAVVQLAAVAGVLRALALLERGPEWRRAGHRLVDSGDLYKLADSAAIALLARGEGLLAQAQREVGSSFEEMSSTVGLVATLMYLCGIDATARPPQGERGDEPLDARDHWEKVQAFVTLAPALALDLDAQTILAQSLERFVAHGSWLFEHLAIAAALATLETAAPQNADENRWPEQGDLVVVPASFIPRLRVILDVLPGA